MANKFKVGEKVTRIEKKEGDIFYSSPPKIKVIEVDGDKFWGEWHDEDGKRFERLFRESEFEKV